jgi:exodeoxyribonuclease VII large subunit
LESRSRILRGALVKRLERCQARLRRCEESVVFKKPLDRIEIMRMRLASTEDRLVAAMRSAAGQSRARAAILASRLEALSPLAVLARGYAVATHASTGRVVRRAADVEIGQAVDVRLSEGSLECEVVKVKK